VSIKILSIAEPGGYNLASKYGGLSITSAGSVGGTGVNANAVATVWNRGSVNAPSHDGVYLKEGGGIFNYTTVYGTIGVVFGVASGAVAGYARNLGTISGQQTGVQLRNGGYIANLGVIEGAAYGVEGLGTAAVNVNNAGTIQTYYFFGASPVAAVYLFNGSVNNSGVITGQSDGVKAVIVGTVENYGSISGVNYGVQIGGGLVINGKATSTHASIVGYAGGVLASGGSVANFGSIAGGATGGAGVTIENSAMLTNGSISDLTALVEGYTGVVASSSASSIANFGSIVGFGAGFGAFGVTLDGGALVNGALKDTSALIEGYTGVMESAGGRVTNFGSIEAQGTYQSAFGVEISGGGTLINGSTRDSAALIAGYTGVVSTKAAVRVANYGAIEGRGTGYYTAAGVDLLDGGTVQNGASNDRSADIFGQIGVELGMYGSVTNFGAIFATTEVAVELDDGGSVVNGGGADVTAIIYGPLGVLVGGGGSVTNFGTIESTYGQLGAVTGDGALVVTNGGGADKAALLVGAIGVDLLDGGTVSNFATITGRVAAGVYAKGGKVTNGAGPDTTALIQGVGGVVETGLASVINTGVIDGSTGEGVSLLDGGNVTNGAGGQPTALIEGVNGVDLKLAGSVANFGTVNGGSGYGVTLQAGGSVTNGGGTSRAALIEGVYGIEVDGGAGTIGNFGTVKASGVAGSYGVSLDDLGELTNGSLTNATALIEGYGGLFLNGNGLNFGTILAEGDAGGAGVKLISGDMVNGASNRAGAVIEGYEGVAVIDAATLSNFGSIIGEGGTAITFGAATDVLAVQAGSVFIGAVNGGGGTLDLASGVGTLSGLLSASGAVTVSGSMTPTSFSGFGTVELGTGASFTTAGGTIDAAQALNVAGTLTNTGSLTVAGTLTTTGTLAGNGTLALTGGTASFAAGTSLTIAKVTQSGTSVADVADAALAYAGVWTQSAGTISVAAGDKITFTGVGDSFSGTLAGAGIVALGAGSDTLSGTTISVTDTDIDTATTLSGTIAASGSVFVTTPSITVAATGATLTGGGSFYLSNTATNEIEGASATATLTNVSDKIDGAGLLGGGQMVLVNDVGGLIAGNQALSLTINTGTSTITNAGVIEDTAAGGVTIASAIDNTGTLEALIGTLTVQGAVTGAGVIKIASGSADFTSTTAALAENVSFTGTTGVLELANSQHYTGDVSGFSKTGATSLDLADITYVSGTTKESYSGTATSGILTVTSGAEVANITLEGNYTTSTFTLSNDGHGGTSVVDPTPPAAGAPGHIAPVQPLLTAIASLGAGEGAVSSLIGRDFTVQAPPLLATERP